MIYLDNSATTQLCDEAKKYMLEAMDSYGNPSSRHSVGLEAKRMLDRAREQVGMALGVRSLESGQLIFTSGGTEANNTAILGSVFAKKRRAGDRIITTGSEHPSVENAMKRLEEQGFEVIRLSTRTGVLDFDEYKNALNDRTILVSLMMVNNETGAQYDVARFFSEAKKKDPNIVTHCDAVQGFLKTPFTPQKISADLVSVSAHKIHGPKGVGALYISPEIIKKKLIVPYLCGGGQEAGLRSGTENIIGIAGFGGAAEQGMRTLADDITKMTALRDKAATLLAEAGARPNIPSGGRAPHVLSVTMPDIKSETMLNFLSSKGICVSAGSACSSHARHISSSLIGFGLSEREADTTLRVSLCNTNTDDEIEALAAAVKEGIERLVRVRI